MSSMKWERKRTDQIAVEVAFVSPGLHGTRAKEETHV
jgi:hypothetical protein